MKAARARRGGFAAAVTLLLCAVGAAFAAAAETPAAGRRPATGHLLLNGGGGEASGYWERFLALAGGKDRPIVVLPTASERPEAGAEYVEELEALGATNVRWLALRTRADAAAPENAAVLREASGIYFTGGDQSRITAAILGTPVEKAIRAAYESGGVLGGTSAGLACMSERMITGAGDFERLVADNVELAPGLGFVPEAILDQHFIARQRQNRLISAVLENPTLLGIGVDERTAIQVNPDRTLEVLGEGSVTIFDGRKSAVRRVASGRSVQLAANDLLLHILVAGDRFDLKSEELRARR